MPHSFFFFLRNVLKLYLICYVYVLKCISFPVLTSILKMGIPLVSVFPSPHKLVPGTFQNKVLLQVITTELYLQQCSHLFDNVSETSHSGPPWGLGVY